MDALIILLLLFFAVGPWLLKRPSVKGFLGERKVQAITSLLLNDNDYRRIDDVILPIRNGTTQIDHVIVSVYGLFVIETKNMTGWIFGGENQRQWTQTIYRKSYKFQNPLRQNYLHVKALELALGNPGIPIRSVVVFTGGAKIKSAMPNNVMYASGLSRYIKSFKNPVITPENRDVLIRRIEEARLAATTATRNMHVKSLKGRLSAASQDMCPRCGGNLVERVARKGPSAGRKFIGCSGYPKCKYTRERT